ncbi:MAG: DUF4383 domain-containing protein [Thermoleophilaceae bacterium]|nr:DUF4383 domain-containing protein [Thermoleophilaceae bacterium]
MSSPLRHPAQLGALVVGIAYLAAGLLGFAFTGFTGWVIDTREDMLGFDLNGFHNIVHFGIGAILIGVSLIREPTITQGVLIGGGLVYLLAAALGFTGNLGSLLSIDGLFASDNFLHLGSGLGAILFGLLGGDVARRRLKVQGP